MLRKISPTRRLPPPRRWRRSLRSFTRLTTLSRSPTTARPSQLNSGPYNVNGVPLRRLNPAYVVGTSTNSYFAKQGQRKKRKGENEFFEVEKQEKNALPAEKKESQKTVDTPLLKAIEAIPNLKSYLDAAFSLKAGMKPHELVF